MCVCACVCVCVCVRAHACMHIRCSNFKVVDHSLKYYEWQVVSPRPGDARGVQLISCRDSVLPGLSACSAVRLTVML